MFESSLWIVDSLECLQTKSWTGNYRRFVHKQPKLRMWINYSIEILLRNIRFIEIVWEIYLYANYA